MVEVIMTSTTRTEAEAAYGVPLIHIHDVERHVYGNGIVTKVWGEMKIAAKERVFAKELKLNTIQVLLLTVESGDHYPFTPVKWIYHKGEYGNYASVDIFGPSAAYQYEAKAKSGEISAPSTLPHDGSIWLNFMALGE